MILCKHGCTLVGKLISVSSENIAIVPTRRYNIIMLFGIPTTRMRRMFVD